MWELDAVRRQVDHVQLILSDQRRFSRAERIVSPFAVRRVVERRYVCCRRICRSWSTVEIDPSLARVGRVSAARVALQQVIGNLLINAAESIRESGKQATQGRIRIRAADEGAGAPAGAHLCFEDNGVGIPPEHLARLFEREFSTKARGSGMGLHWSANTVAALGGRIYAESAGPGQGACIHLLLPLADAAAPPLENAA